MKPGIYENVPELAYHSDTSTLSASGAKTLLSDPERFAWERSHGRPPKAAFDLGGVVHATPHAYTVLLAALTLHGTPGETWTAASWRDEATTAQLSGAEMDSAHIRAVREGFLVRRVQVEGGEKFRLSCPSPIPSRKGGSVAAYVVVRLPQHAPPERVRDAAEVPGQMALLEVVGT